MGCTFPRDKVQDVAQKPIRRNGSRHGSHIHESLSTHASTNSQREQDESDISMTQFDPQSARVGDPQPIDARRNSGDQSQLLRDEQQQLQNRLESAEYEIKSYQMGLSCIGKCDSALDAVLNPVDTKKGQGFTEPLYRFCSVLLASSTKPIYWFCFVLLAYIMLSVFRACNEQFNPNGTFELGLYVSQPCQVILIGAVLHFIAMR